MKNAAIFLLMLLIAAAIAVGGWLLARPNPANPEIVRLEKDLKNANAQIERLQEALDTMKATATKAAASSAKPAGAAAVKGEDSSPADKQNSAFVGNLFSSAKSGMSAYKELLKNPGMRDMINQQNLAQMDMRYGGLFDHFKLSPEEKQNLKQLLAARSRSQIEMGIKVMEDNLTPAQKKQISDDYDRAKKASDESIRTFLGDDEDFKAFQRWEDTSPERTQLQMMGGRGQFEAVGEPLTPEQEERLIDIMAAVRKSPGGPADMTNPKGFSPDKMTDEMLQKLLTKQEHDAKTVVQNAAGFLSTRQLEALVKMQQQQRSMTEMGLKMSQSFLKSGK